MQLKMRNKIAQVFVKLQ